MPDPVAKTTGLVEAAHSLEKFLDATSDTEVTPEEEAAAAPAEEAEASEAPPEEVEETPEEAAPEEEAAAEDEEAEAAPTEPPLYTVKINGKEEQLPGEELAKGYQRHAVFSQKTAELADERRAFDSERQAVSQERAQYAQLLTALETQLRNGLEKEPDWEALYAEDPLNYVRQKDIWRERQDRVTAAQFEQQRVSGLKQQEHQEAINALVIEGRQRLVEAVPEWKDAKKWEADRTKLLTYGKTQGFTEQELSQAYDPRAILALHKARKYDELVAKKPVPVVRKSPPVLAAGPANVVKTRSVTDETKAKQRLAQTGRVVDAAAVFEKFL